MSRAAPGNPGDLGARWDGAGTNVAVWAPRADLVEFCRYDGTGQERRHPLPARSGEIWHGYLADVGPGTRYGLRLTGPDCDPARLLLDPYTLAVDGNVVPHGSVFPGGRGDTAPYVPRSVVVDPTFDWGPDRAPAVAWNDTVIYEAHVRGFTRCHPGIPEALRGTYAGLGHPAALAHLSDLGVTTVELLPVQQFASEPALPRRGLTNYWGYNTLGFLAPHGPYSSSGTCGQQVGEFKSMVRSLHAAGLEVILDVVYNHTAEGRLDGPVLSLRGIDDAAYYRHDPDDPSRYLDTTGCGNTLDVSGRPGLRLVMDSLRYWVQQMHVDGFRFDLAPALARTAHGVDLGGAFVAAVGQDPVLRHVKLIAEPWDVGRDGYQVGNFPPPWAEWNDRYRDCVRDFWRGRSGGVRELASRLSGSSDLFRGGGRGPLASVNYVTCHDGFTLRDLVSYDRKHNAANGEGNRDGEDDNRSWNCGTEGPADDPVEALRRRQARNLLMTLLLSAGVPMLSAGDEQWHTQHGNNNAYCQDSELSYLPWPGADGGLREWIRQLLRLRRESPALRPADFLDGRLLPGRGGVREMAWFGPDGAELDDAGWHDRSQATLGLYVDGRLPRRSGAPGRPAACYLLWLHSGPEDVVVTLPAREWGRRYDVVLDTADEHPRPGPVGLRPGISVAVPARSAMLLRCHPDYSPGRSVEVS